MLTLRNTLAAALPLLFAACSATGDKEPLVVGATVLGGELHVARFEVQAGVNAFYDRDLVVVSDGDILILGKLHGLAGDPARAESRGADLVLRSRTRIVVAGELVGAPGRDGSLDPRALALLGEDPHGVASDPAAALEHLTVLVVRRPDAPSFDGGRGGNLVLEAPEIWIEKAVAGAGGAGGPAARGGAGGTLYTQGGLALRDTSPGGSGGAAGAAGPSVSGYRGGVGGAGGAGGSAGIWPPPTSAR